MEMEEIVGLLKKHTTDVETALKGFDGTTEDFKRRLAAVEKSLSNIRLPAVGSRIGPVARLGLMSEGTESWGAQVAANEGLEAFAENETRPGILRIEIKSITSAVDSGGALVVPERDDTVMQPKRRRAVRSLLNSINVSSGSVQYASQNTRENNADVVPEGSQKPESAYDFELKDAKIRTIAHWVPASRQILADAPQLSGLIDTELRYGLQLKEDEEILYGDGTGVHLDGLVPNSTPFAAPIAIDNPNSIDKLGQAILQAELSDLPADGIVLHPSDWTWIRLLKNADGDYIMGPPGTAVEPRLFGLPVVTTPAMTQDKFLVGSFQMAATLYDRMAPIVLISTEHADFFTRNMVAILAEERIGQAVKRKAALTYGDFGRAA